MRRYRLFLVVALLIGGMGARGMAEIPAEHLKRAAAHTDTGNDLLSKGDSKGAQEHFDQALTLVPTFPDALLGIGHLRMKAGAFAEALLAYENARDSFAKVGLDIFEVRLRTYAKIQDQISRINSSISAMGDPHGSLSALAKIRDMEQTRRNLSLVQMPSKESAQEAPGEIFFHIGNAHFRMNHLDEAVTNWGTCARLSPRFAQVHNNLAVAYWRQRQFENAKRHLAKAAELGFPVPPKMKEDLDKAAALATQGQ